MHPSRQVTIGDAASFVGTTPRAIRHYHEIGLLPEPERGGDDRRRYGYEQLARLLWIRAMADAGIALDDIRDAVLDTSPARGDGDPAVTDVLEELERTLATREAELRRQQTAVRRMRARGSRIGLLSDLAGDRLMDLPAGSLRQADLDSVLVVERMFGPVAAAIHATRFIALATDPALREEADRIDAAEEALDDTVRVEDPRVAQVAARRHAFEQVLHAAIEESGLAAAEQALVDSWDAAHPVADPEGDDATGESCTSSGLGPAALAMAKDFSPARLRCIELTQELALAT